MKHILFVLYSHSLDKSIVSKLSFLSLFINKDRDIN